ncbi:MAG: hypothetical protein HY318_13880 [Armatimonadetes bacterium]|nr:hypothetical protein [Armatimonadota bacterium]
MTSPNAYQLGLLSEAISHLTDSDIAPYLKLKRLFAEQPSGFEVDFRRTFESYYGLNAGGVSKTFKDRYFDLLLGLKIEEGLDPYTPILKELYEFPRRRGDKALQCSFVSKLVAIHDETRPIFDRHVSDFFGITVPSNGSVDFRIAGFVTNLRWLRDTYHRWSEDNWFQKILLMVRKEHHSLESCADPRVTDFLVWTVGRKKLGSNTATELRP